MQTLKSDNTKEYLSKPFLSFMLQHEILYRISCVDTPSQNGVVERKNRHLLKIAWALLFQMNVPKHFWVDVVSTTCFLINRMPSSVLNWATHYLFPNNLLFLIDPKVFGCICFVWDVRPQVSKLDLKSLKCIFVGYSRVQKGYRCYCPTLRRYFVSINVAFFETTHFPFHLLLRIRGRKKTCLFILFPHPLSLPNMLLSLLR